MPTVRPSHVTALQERLARFSTPPLLVSTHVSKPLSDLLRRRRIAFIDTAGNAFLSADNTFVLVTGRPAPVSPQQLRSLPPSAWKIAYILLRNPEAEALSVRALGAQAGVSHGAASNALRALEQRGWIRHLGRAGHPVTDFEALLRAWEVGHSDRLAPKLFETIAEIPRGQSLRGWASALSDTLGPDRALIGGGLGAELHGSDLVASTATVHVAAWGPAMMRDLRLVPARHGHITVRRTFGVANHNPEHPHLADPLLIRADLGMIPDERLLPARAELHELLLKRWRRS